ncbi:MAG: MgtC/SapB family protein [Syntrophomonadaceae bacterium]|nr:MgtC/SapB family protein [Syntrophomonadaceae bacterium]
MTTLEIVLRLILASILGGLIGLERESLNRPAGFRTYTLVCIGSALAMIVSLEVYLEYHRTVTADPGRIAAQVISGIGFLGAGTIMREGATVKGLTTAAGLWGVACVGLAVGAGMYIPAVVGTILMLFVLIYFSRVENYFTGLRSFRGIVVQIDDQPGMMGSIGNALGEMGVSIKKINMNASDKEHEKLEVELLLDLPAEVRIEDVMTELAWVKGVSDINRLN